MYTSPNRNSMSEKARERETILQQLEQHCRSIGITFTPRYSPAKLVAIDLCKANKRLRLKIQRETEVSYEVVSYIENVNPQGGQHGTTTALYNCAKAVLTFLPSYLEKDVLYSFATRNPSMYRWAETTGRRIFNWKNRARLSQSTFFEAGVRFPFS
jgi:hypothetical protein